MGNKKRKHKKPETMNRNSNHSSTGGRGPWVWYNGDPTDVDPLVLKKVEESAQFAIDVYNRTHLSKYKFVNVKTATRDTMTLYMLLTARLADDDEQNPVTFIAWISLSDNYVKRVEIAHRTDLLAADGCPSERDTEINYFESGDRSRCDDKTRDILKKLTALPLEACNKTHHMKYSLVELLLATGQSSAGSVVDLLFTAKPKSLCMGSNSADTFQARVSFEHKNVEFVERIHDNDLACIR